MGELAGAVSAPKYPVTEEPFDCPASQISVVAGTTTEPACAAKLLSATASGISAAARNVLKSERLFGLGAVFTEILLFMVSPFNIGEPSPQTGPSFQHYPIKPSPFIQFEVV
jgi:hypothetical protein